MCLIFIVTGCVNDTFEAPSNQVADDFANRVSEFREEGPFEPKDFKDLSTIDHAHLDVILQSFIGTTGGRYESLFHDQEAQQLLADYKMILRGARPESMKVPEQRLTFWLNAYTALAVDGLAHLVATHGTDVQISRDDFALYTKQRHQVAGFEVTLEEIEHLVLRGDRTYPDVLETPSELADELVQQHRLIFPTGQFDARVNFAVSFGARGFPPMPMQAYRANTIDAVLEARTREFINDPVFGANDRGVSVLFDWFRRDFILGAGSITAFISTYLSDPTRLIDTSRTLQYGWTVR